MLEVEHTAVFPPEFEPDRAVVAAIRLFDPKYVPLFVRRTFRSPTGAVDAFGYHVIGRHITDWHSDEEKRLPVHLAEVPSIWPYAGGTVYAQRTWSLPWTKGSWQYRASCPDLYLPHDMELCRWMEAVHRFMFADARSVITRIKEMFRRVAEAEQAELKKAQALAKDKLHDDKSELRDAVENELHWMEHPRQNPNVLPPDPTPFVHLQQSTQGVTP